MRYFRVDRLDFSGWPIGVYLDFSKGTNISIHALYQYGTQKDKAMLVISSREFRQNQRFYFDKVDDGEQVVVQRGKDKSYALSAVTEDDMYFSAEMMARIKKSLGEAEMGQVVSVSTKAELKALLDSL